MGEICLPAEGGVGDVVELLESVGEVSEEALLGLGVAEAADGGGEVDEPVGIAGCFEAGGAGVGGEEVVDAAVRGLGVGAEDGELVAAGGGAQGGVEIVPIAGGGEGCGGCGGGWDGGLFESEGAFAGGEGEGREEGGERHGGWGGPGIG
ncbi:MAG: hypothetical protein EA378_03945 [Phycisphaerales bacterium]|nr:MAG: hypothetical protein EA378_03945 [Phycisphaerales bacterium]